MIPFIGPPPASNYHQGRDGNPISGIIQHWMAGSFESALSRFQNPSSIVSAHYLVGQQRGRIVQLVDDGDTAYHAGEWQTNILTIGIEAEASPVLPPSADLYLNLIDLYRLLAKKHDLVLAVGTTVRPHNAIVATACPGTLDLMRIVRGAQEEDVAFADDPVAVAYREDVRTSFEAVKAALKEQSDAIAALTARIDKLHAI